MRRHWFDHAKYRNFGNIHIHIDEATGLNAIVAIHSTALGPALGGCRVVEYETIEDAMMDAMRLARAMSFKAAMVGLPQGGGKSVLLKPKEIKDREAYFKAFGRFVNSLSGQYITAIDSGSTVQDMDVIATETNFVTSTSKLTEDTSLYTAKGVFLGLKRAVQVKLGSDNLSGKKVAIQGVGNVGYHLASLLKEEGAELFITDVNEDNLTRTKNDTGAEVVAANDIYSLDCDVFAPCALGSIINSDTLPLIKAPIIAGAANNQLHNADFGKEVFDKNIFYVPDYVLNAGGLIYCSCEYNELGKSAIQDRLENIATSVEEIYQRSQSENKPTNLMVDEIAQQLIDKDK